MNLIELSLLFMNEGVQPFKIYDFITARITILFIFHKNRSIWVHSTCTNGQLHENI